MATNMSKKPRADDLKPENVAVVMNGLSSSLATATATALTNKGMNIVLGIGNAETKDIKMQECMSPDDSNLRTKLQEVVKNAKDKGQVVVGVDVSDNPNSEMFHEAGIPYVMSSRSGGAGGGAQQQQQQQQGQGVTQQQTSQGAQPMETSQARGAEQPPTEAVQTPQAQSTMSQSSQQAQPTMSQQQQQPQQQQVSSSRQSQMQQQQRFGNDLAVIADDFNMFRALHQQMWQDASRRFPRLLRGWNVEGWESMANEMDELSQSTDRLLESFDRLFGEEVSQSSIRRVRDASEAESYGVPKNYIEGHAHSQFKLKNGDGSSSFVFQQAYNGDAPAAEGVADSVMFLAQKSLQQQQKPRIFSLLDVMETPFARIANF